RWDGSPIYNFCVVVDDVDMRMTHVVRGDDHLTNTPRQILLYQALGATLPRFAHIPLILGTDKTRLSKRHGATSVMQYHDEGYLPEAMVNFLARLGWSHGDQELFTRAELIEHFSLENVGTSAAIFNPEKLVWTNFQYLKATPAAELAELVKPFLHRLGLPVPADSAWLTRAVETVRERAKTLVELAEALRFYVAAEITIEAAAATKHLRADVAPALADLTAALDAATAWDPSTIEGVFRDTIARHGLALGKLAQPVRVALTGGTVSP